MYAVLMFSLNNFTFCHGSLKNELLSNGTFKKAGRKWCVHAFLGFSVERKNRKIFIICTYVDTHVDAHRYCNNNIAVAVAHGHHA